MSRNVVMAEEHLFLRLMKPFFLHFGVEQAQSFGMVEHCYRFTFHQVIYRDHAILILENLGNLLSDQ